MPGHHGHQRLPVGQNHGRIPMLGTAGQGLAVRASPSQEQGSHGDIGAAPAAGIGHLPGHGNRDSLRLCWDVHLQVGLAWQGPWLGRGHGEVETSPAAASVRQGMMVPRADMGSWNLGRVGGTLSV